MSDAIATLFPDVPPRFLANELDALTNGAYRWRSIKNLRCKGRIPDDCFVKVSPRKVFIIRDEFFKWAEMYAKKK